jgi:NTP pyrophosphatase (non-canonical NTP hydrolase)
VGELRNIVKWEQDQNVLRRVMEDNREEVKDGIGDIYWYLALLGNMAGINVDDAIDEVIKPNGKRFPVKDIKSRHTNLYLGGKDKKYN